MSSYPSQAHPELDAAISRCVEALPDFDRLRSELGRLRGFDSQKANFAVALFDLERARRGDDEAKGRLTDVAEALLSFWHEKTGAALADSHPALRPMWDEAAALLASFELRRFNQALTDCWTTRHNVDALREKMRLLMPQGNRRVEFALCLYHLELARMQVSTSRAEFAKRVNLLNEAYLSKEIASQLTGDDPGLKTLWKDVRPYLDEFFDALEEKEKVITDREAKVPTQEVIAEAPTERMHGLSSEQTPREPLPAFAPAVLPSPDLSVGLPDGASTIEADVFAEQETVTTDLYAAALEELDAQPPPRPPDTTPVPTRPSRPPDTTPVPAKPPPRPKDLTPVSSPAARPPPKPSDMTPLPGSIEAERIISSEVLVDALPAPPPLPARTPTQEEFEEVDADMVTSADNDALDEATAEFWRAAEKNLELLPPLDRPRLNARVFDAEDRNERKKLTTFLDEARKHEVPQAKAFSCLLRLYLAGQLKEKTLFGQPNPRRKEAFIQALELLSTDAVSAAQCAVWFDLDGAQTRQQLFEGLQILIEYLAHCDRQQLDPLEPNSPYAFMG